MHVSRFIFVLQSAILDLRAFIKQTTGKRLNQPVYRRVDEKLEKLFDNQYNNIIKLRYGNSFIMKCMNYKWLPTKATYLLLHFLYLTFRLIDINDFFFVSMANRLSQTPRSKAMGHATCFIVAELRGIWPSQHSPDGQASLSARLIARGNKKNEQR